MWYRMLSDLTPEQFYKGIKTFCLKHKDIFPTTNIVAYIREYALIDESIPTPEEAWGEVIKAIARYGYCGKPEFSSPLIANAVECIGWRDMCMSENIGVERAHFMRAYSNLVKREHDEKICGVINADR